ncbi:MAG: NADH-quinone oxidoreductase subunit NuoE [Dehalococcoidia bacterium]|nr:MAG: NADH-quinone oxidoreductase subunit NuoE [Dehalococcoidia bacterium]
MGNPSEIAKLDLKPLDEILSRYQDQKWPLIPLLQDVQDEFGYIPPEAIEPIARGTGLFPAQVQGVVTFYEQFHMAPRGKNIVKVCRGTACHVRGGSTILKIVKQNLDVDEGETTPDMQFTLETVPCLGTCFLAPAMMLNKDYFGKLAPPKLRSILQQYSKQENE